MKRGKVLAIGLMSMDIALEARALLSHLSLIDGKPHHELGFFYLVTPPAEAPQLDLEQEFYGTEENGTPLIFRWHRLDELANLNLFPAFLKNSLSTLPTSITHIIQKDPTD